MLKTSLIKTLALWAVATALAGQAAVAQTVICVDADAPGANDGSCWVDAFTDLQDALAMASTSGTIEQVRVAEATYTPDRGTGVRTATFQLVDGVAVMGGYAGYGEPDPDARDLAAHETILSGDLLGNDAGSSHHKYRDNSYHVVTGSGTHATAVLNGFTISGGRRWGGGVYIIAGSPTVKDCRFSSYGSSAMYSRSSSPTVDNCTFVDNTAERGAGMYNESSSPNVMHCTFIGNFADGYGGGMYNKSSNPTVTDCIFSGNDAECGGGIYNYYSNPTLTNCTFSGNETGYYGGGGIFNEYSDSVIVNCIFWENTGGPYVTTEENQVYDRNGIPNVNCCCIEGWSGAWGGAGNFGDDPLFVDAAGADGQVGTLDDDLHLAPGSPCINSGDDDATGMGDVDYDGDARVQECRVDIGADETDFLLVDCNGNTAADICDIVAGTSEDCNANDVPDECEPDEDCNINGIQDICDLAAGTGHDWNNNGILDTCDIAAGTSSDVNGDGVPDEAVLLVDADAVGANNGSSWEDAYTDLKNAISAGCGSDVVSQIRVAAGTYKPTAGTDREARFELCNGLTILGGYAGYGEPDPDARDIQLYETVLSGDLNDDDVGTNGREENSYHVVSNVQFYSSRYTYSPLDASAVLDGFTIAGGNMSGSGNDEPSTYWRAGGGGMQLGHGSPIIRNCTFRGNSAEWDGGGLCSYYGRPTLVNCVFIENRAGHDGGGVCNHGGHVTLISSVFIRNAAENDGGGVFTDDYWNEASTTLIGCTFIENTADAAYGFGGGARGAGKTTAINCVLGGNTAYGGGGMYNSWGGARLANSTFSSNWTVHNGAGFFSYGLSSTATLANCLLWDNKDSAGTAGEDEQVAASSGQLAVNHSCVQDLDHFTTNGVGNIGVDPLLADPVGPDGIPGTEDDDVHLLAGSPCIDAGDNTTVPFDGADLDGDGDMTERTPLDLAGNPRFVDDPDTDDTGVPDPPGYLDIVDMGAYEFFPECRTIVIDGCDTGVANLLLAGEGCTMADRIAECAEEARNHGAFVSCVAHLSNGWKRAGLISGGEKGSIQQCAAQANIP